MELQDLVGEYMLDAVDFDTEQARAWGGEFRECQVMRFRLDGRVYIAVEDPADGYRSCMDQLIVVDDVPIHNTFPPSRVIGRMRDNTSYGGEDVVLELIDAVTNKVVVEVGTDAADGYYPCFVASFHPESMAINAE